MADINKLGADNQDRKNFKITGCSEFYRVQPLPALFLLTTIFFIFCEYINTQKSPSTALQLDFANFFQKYFISSAFYILILSAF